MGAAMIPAATIARLAGLKLSAEQATVVAEMMSEVEAATEAKAGAAIAARRASDRERKERQRHVTSRDVTGQHVTSGTDPSPDKEGPQTPKKTNPSLTLPSVGFSSAREAAFGQFWEAYPHKVGKDDARKSFARVGDQKRATLPDLLAGIKRYRQTKPVDQPWCNPSTWLNQGRWQDEPAPSPSPNNRPGPAAHGQRAGPMGNNSIDAAKNLLERMRIRDEQDPFDSPGERSGFRSAPYALAFR